MKRLFFSAIHEKTVEKVQEVVASGAFNRPRTSQRLVSHQDLFSHYVETSVTGIGRAASVLKESKVLFRFEEAVRMIDSQSGHKTALHQVEDKGVHGREDLRILRTNGGEIINIEEPPVVNLIHGDAPIAQPVGLTVEQSLQAIKAVRIAALTIQLAQSGLDGLRHLGTSGGELAEPPLHDFLFALPFADF